MRTRTRLLMASAAGLAAVAAATITTSAVDLNSRSASKIRWTDCADALLDEVGMQCGSLQVPMDYAKPHGRKITIAVSRIPATAKKDKRQGPLLVNPGGPGGEGLYLPLMLKLMLPKDVSRTYDLVGFDPRGVGASRPAMTCSTGLEQRPRPDYRPNAGAVGVSPNEQAWLARAKAYAQACRKHRPGLIKHMRSLDTIHDMESIRKALGTRRINFYGFSYGSYLGTLYATTFPEHMRRMVLDGLVNPAEVWYQANLKQSVGFEGAMGEFWKWIARFDDTYHLGTTAQAVQATYVGQLDRLARTPLGRIGPAEFTDVFVNAGYNQAAWPTIGIVFSEWMKGNHLPLRRVFNFYNAGSDNSHASYLAVTCSDGQWSRNYATWKADAQRTASTAPFLTWSNTWFNAPCLYWGAPQQVPTRVNGSKAPPALLVNSTLDGATPYLGALALRAVLSKSTLIAEIGQSTHAHSLSGNRCVDSRIFKYLRKGELPGRTGGTGADVNCVTSPPPIPLGIDPGQLTAASEGMGVSDTPEPTPLPTQPEGPLDPPRTPAAGRPAGWG